MLQSVQVVDGALRMGRSGKDGAFVSLQHFQPMSDVAGMILEGLRRDLECAAKECRTQLGDQLFYRIGVIAQSACRTRAQGASGVPSSASIHGPLLLHSFRRR